METEDRLLIQIELMGKVLAQAIAKVLDLRFEPTLTWVQEEVYQALKEEAALDLPALLDKPPAEALLHLNESLAFSESQKDQLAELLWEIGRGDHLAPEQPTAERHRQLALAYAIYQELNRTSITYSLERERRMGLLRQKFDWE